MSKHILEELAQTNPDCEIWWDSSPLVYQQWAESVLSKASANKKTEWAEQLDRLYNPETASTTGKMGFRGVTTNPPLCLQAILSDPDYWVEEIRQTILQYPSDDVEGIYWKVYLETVRRGAELIRPVFEESEGKYGYLSGQVDPRFVTDLDRMRANAADLKAIASNIMVKVPGSKEGYQLIEELTAEGVSTNNTTSFTVPQYKACMDAVSRGLEKARANAVDLSRWRSVITHMSARLGNIGDLLWQAEERGIEISPEEITLGELAVLKRAYRHIQETGHPSKMLMCSMRVHHNAADGTASSWHIEKLAGGDFVYTCPPSYIAALMEHEDKIPPFDADAVNEDISEASLKKLLELPYFRQAYEFDGMASEEFSRFGAFIPTASEFAVATRKTIDFVARVYADTKRQAA
ncbi:transaldolase family protein [Pelagibius sp. Alg239-R121]|uniref:transaldolase family protein n=1 Tax=Pelagibius sp. Alg239-R121 TaxID=2993448 RepID=UPI0024A73C5D|nr:transaldolase family protein [Pelagibius sp. Alg239-R121]